MGAWDEFLHSPVEVGGAVVTIAGGVISLIWKPLRRFWIHQWDRALSRPFVPRETLRIIQSVNSSYWCDAKTGDKPVMQVVFDGHVTEISGQPVRVLRGEIPKPKTQGDMVLIANGHDGRRPQVLSPNESAEIHTLFFVDTKTPAKGKPWQSDVVFTDQYGNRHRVKRCVFKAAIPDVPALPKEPEEFPYTIADPIEKEVVSVLKSELSRYNICGRRCGGLGSVHIVYQGRAFTGVGSDGWRPDSPVNQAIAPDPEVAILASDNLDALLSG